MEIDAILDAPLEPVRAPTGDQPEQDFDVLEPYEPTFVRIYRAPVDTAAQRALWGLPAPANTVLGRSRQRSHIVLLTLAGIYSVHLKPLLTEII